MSQLLQQRARSQLPLPTSLIGRLAADIRFNGKQPAHSHQRLVRQRARHAVLALVDVPHLASGVAPASRFQHVATFIQLVESSERIGLQCAAEVLQVPRRVRDACSRALRTDPTARALLKVPGIGPLGASALRAELGDGSAWKNSREFACCRGLVPRHTGTGARCAWRASPNAEILTCAPC